MNKFKFLNIQLILLFAILIFAFVLRVYDLGYSPLWIDEATSSMASKMIIEKGVPIFDSGLVYRDYIFHYVQAFFLLFGINDFNARLVSVLFGMLTIVLAYLIGKEYSKTGGIVAALFFSVFYLEVFFSRQARFYQLFQLMFFLSIYLLYKSGEYSRKSGEKISKNSKKEIIYLIGSLVAFFIALDTQIAALVLAPFIILHILYYNTKYNKLLAILPAISLFQKFMPAVGLSSVSTDSTMNYSESYYAFTNNMHYLLILFIPGLFWSFFKKKKLTLLIIIPSIVMLIGIFSLQTFALRYAYFFVFPLVLYFSLFFSFLYEKYGKIMLITLFCVLIIPSNLIFPYTYVNIIKPINYNHAYNDYSSPEANYKSVPENIIAKLKDRDNVLISLFSSDLEWYVRKPDYVIPFTMDGRGSDQISWNKTIEIGNMKVFEVVDRYSGARMIDYEIINTIKRPYYVTADSFSVSKLKLEQKESFDKLINGCEVVYSASDLKVYGCS